MWIHILNCKLHHWVHFKYEGWVLTTLWMWFNEILTLPQAEVAVFFLALASASSSSDKPQVQFLHAFFFFGPSPQVAEVTLKPIAYFSYNSKLLNGYPNILSHSMYQLHLHETHKLFLFSSLQHVLTAEFVKKLYSVYSIQVQYVIMNTIRPKNKLKKLYL